MPVLFRFPNGGPSSETLRAAAGNASSVSFDTTAITTVGSQYRGYGAVSPTDLDSSQEDDLTTAIEDLMGHSVEGPISQDEALTQQYSEV